MRDGGRRRQGGISDAYIAVAAALKSRSELTQRIESCNCTTPVTWDGEAGGFESAQVTDPNAVFAQGGAQANAANGTASGVPSRRGRGLFRTPPIYDLSLVDLTVGNDAAWGVDVLHGDLVGHWHHQVTFGRRNPIAAHDNNNLVMNAGERAG